MSHIHKLYLLGHNLVSFQLTENDQRLYVLVPYINLQIIHLNREANTSAYPPILPPLVLIFSIAHPTYYTILPPFLLPSFLSKSFCLFPHWTINFLKVELLALLISVSTGPSLVPGTWYSVNVE